VGRWVEDSPILYIGKADPAKGGMHSRVKPYARRGRSQTGGRAIWQLVDAHELRGGWAPTGEENGRTVEQRWIARFEETFGRKPFANVASRAAGSSFPSLVSVEHPSYLSTIPPRPTIQQTLKHPSMIRARRSDLRA
jgi:hypothetical protein